jgi:hypothetical protein
MDRLTLFFLVFVLSLIGVYLIESYFFPANDGTEKVKATLAVKKVLASRSCTEKPFGTLEVKNQEACEEVCLSDADRCMVYEYDPLNMVCKLHDTCGAIRMGPYSNSIFFR